MSHKKRVLLLPTYEDEFSRNLVLGVGTYAMAYGPWELDVPGMRGSTRVRPELTAWEGDGVLMPVVMQDQVDEIRQKGVPYVNVTAFNLPNTVRNDNEAIAVMACEHLYAKGFRWFAYFEANSKTDALDEAADAKQAPRHRRLSAPRVAAPVRRRAP